jgi:hypothetical protein
MPVLQGSIQYIKVGDDFCWAQIKEDGTGTLEPFALWWYTSGDTKPPSYKRTIQNMQFELLKAALLKGLSVAIQWEESTGAIQNVKLLASP